MRIIVGLVIFLSLSSSLFALGDPNKGKVLSEPCAACHNADGNSAAGIYPKIAGQHEQYLIKVLKDYRAGEDGKRYEPTMAGMTASLSDQDIEDLAAYFSKQKMSPGATPESLLTLGQAIYRGGNITSGVPACIACHGPVGTGNDLASFPRLSGQHAEYIANALKSYKEGKRKGNTADIMHDVVKHMTNEEIEAVSSYVSGLH